MNVLIFSGGTGSVALQTWLHKIYGDKLNVQVITNTQDNGKSTGTVRKVLDGKINGPSDLRKNQVLRYELQGGNQNLIKVLNKRFDASAQDAKDYCLSLINSLVNKDLQTPLILTYTGVVFDIDMLAINTMIKGVDSFFAFQKSLQVDYIDFSLANIIYAGLAAENMSLEEAGMLMARNVLQIPEDAVIVADDTSLYLQAITESGRIISDEGDIVDWNNPLDKIVDTFFVDEHGKNVKGVLTSRALKAIDEADLIVFSSGTQWSSLIPTYQHELFKEAIAKTTAKKYLIVNNVQDRDMTGVNVNDMLSIINRYLNLDDVTCVFNEQSTPEMSLDVSFFNTKNWNFLIDDLSSNNKKIHDGKKLVQLIMIDYYKNYLNNKTIIFDYDDTLVGRNSTYVEASKENKNILISLSSLIDYQVCICTGNSIKAINFSEANKESQLTVFAEGGVHCYKLKYEFGDEFALQPSKIYFDHDYIVGPEYIFSQAQIDDVVSQLEEIGINVFKIQNRNNAIISIKPIDPEYRKPLSILLKKIFPNLTVMETGRTTIDISLGAQKSIILRALPNIDGITVIGDESHEGGNDHSLYIIPNVDFLKVKNPNDTNVFLKTLACKIRDKR